MGKIENVGTVSEMGSTQPDGGMYISPEDLKLIGGGDVKAGRRFIRMAIADEREPRVHQGPTSQPENVRLAGPEDEINVLALLIPHLHATVGRVWPVDNLRVLEHIQRGTQRKGGIVGVIDGEDGRPVAATVMMPAQSAASKAFYIHVVFNFVHPDHRRSRHAEDLVNYERWCSDEWSRNFGYPVPVIHTMHTEDKVREKNRFYRRFMNPVGAVFAYPFPVMR